MDSKYRHALLWMKVESNRPRQCHSPELFSHITYKDTWNISIKNKYCCTCERVEHKHRQQTSEKNTQYASTPLAWWVIYPSISRYIYYLFLTMLNMSSSWAAIISLPVKVLVAQTLTSGWGWGWGWGWGCRCEANTNVPGAPRILDPPLLLQCVLKLLKGCEIVNC